MSRPPGGRAALIAAFCLAALACAGSPSGQPGVSDGEPSHPGLERAPAPLRGRPAAGTPVRRIVSLAPNVTEILFALGLGDRVAGVTDYCNFPPEAARLPKIGGFVNPSAEAILALRPDLVIATPNVGNRPFVERVLAVGARVCLVQARNVEEIFPAIETIAEAAGAEEAGRSLAREIRAGLDREARRVAGLPRPRVLFCLQIEPLLVAGPGSYPADLIALAGGENIVDAGAGAYPVYSMETVIQAAPQTIIQSLMDTAGGAAGERSLMEFWRRFPSIPAVAESRVRAVSGDILLRPGPRAAEGVARLIAVLHPDLLREPSAARGAAR